MDSRQWSSRSREKDTRLPCEALVPNAHDMIHHKGINENKIKTRGRERLYLPISPVVRMRVLRSPSSRLTLAVLSASLRRETRSFGER